MKSKLIRIGAGVASLVISGLLVANAVTKVSAYMEPTAPITKGFTTVNAIPIILIILIAISTFVLVRKQTKR